MSLPCPCSVRSEKNTSCWMPSLARSARMSSIIASRTRSLTIGQPLGLGLVAERAGDTRAASSSPDRDQVVAGIEAARDLDDLAERLAVAQERRLGEHLDLPAGVVDVVLAGHVVARVGHQRGQRVAEHRAAGMAHMHRAGRVGRDVLDVDLLALADVGAAEIGAAARGRRAAPRCQAASASRKLRKPGPATSTRGDLGIGLEGVGERGRDLARVLAQRLCRRPSRRWSRDRHARDLAAARPRSWRGDRRRDRGRVWSGPRRRGTGIGRRRPLS